MPTISGTLRMTASRVPDRVALVHGDRSRTYSELDAEADRVAGALARLGLRKGDRLALMGANSDRLIVTCYAALRLGLILVPANPALAAPEVLYLLADSGASAIAVDPALAGTVTLLRAAGLPPATRHVLSLGPAAGCQDLMELVGGTDAGEIPDAPAESGDALILYTSGTTGRPKGALFDHHRTLWTATAAIAARGLRDGDRFLHVAPLTHAAQLCIMLIPGTLIGATHVVLPGFEPEASADPVPRD